MKMLKQCLKKMAGLLFFYIGIFHVVRFINNCAGRRLTIVTYHRVGDRSIANMDTSLPYLFTSAEIFQQQLYFFSKWYTIITFKDLNTFAAQGSMPRNCLIITFDDGYEDNYLHAYPILQRMNLSATYFIISDLVKSRPDPVFWWDRAYYYFNHMAQKEEDNRFTHELNPEIVRLYDEFKQDPSKLFARLNGWNDEKIINLLDTLRDTLQINHTRLYEDNRLMTWEQVRSMRKNVHFGSHTCTHSNLVRIEQAQREYEIRESKKRIEQEVHQSIEVFSYPCGNIDEKLKETVENAGYKFAVTTQAGVNNLRDHYALRRINIWEGSSLSMHGKFSKGYFAFTLSGCAGR